MRNWRLIGLGVKLRVLITGCISSLCIHHTLFTLLEHTSSLSLVLLVSRHDFLQLLVRIMNILNLCRIGGNEKPLVHIYDVDIKRGILLLEALGVIGSLVTVGKSTTNLDTEFVILLGCIGTHNRETRIDLTRYSGIILFERHYIST